MGNSNNRRTVKSILLVKKFLELVEMSSGLANAISHVLFLKTPFNNATACYDNQDFMTLG